MRLSDLKIDADRKENGDWVPLADFDASVKVRGRGNFDWQRLEAEETRRITLAEKVSGGLSAEQQRRVTIFCLLNAGLLDWKGELFTGDDGEPIPYSKEKAGELLTDPDFELLVNLMLGACQSVALSARQETEAAAKN